MTITTVATEAVMITDVNGLDPIHVFWVDVEPGRGYVTIICFGAAWTAYFGAMGGNTIRQFFARADTDYLVSKMGLGVHLKQSKRNDAYLAKIIDAVKACAKLVFAPLAKAPRDGEDIHMLTVAEVLGVPPLMVAGMETKREQES